MNTVKTLAGLIMQYNTPRAFGTPLPAAWPTIGEALQAGLDGRPVIGARRARNAARIILALRRS